MQNRTQNSSRQYFRPGRMVISNTVAPTRPSTLTKTVVPRKDASGPGALLFLANSLAYGRTLVMRGITSWLNKDDMDTQLLKAASSRTALLEKPVSPEKELPDEPSTSGPTSAPLPDLLPYLKKTSTSELAEMRRLSSLSAACYRMPRLTPTRLRHMAGLELITTSRAVLLESPEYMPNPREVFESGDGMAPALSLQEPDGDAAAHVAPSRSALSDMASHHEATHAETLARIAEVEPLVAAAAAAGAAGFPAPAAAAAAAANGLLAAATAPIGAAAGTAQATFTNLLSYINLGPGNSRKPKPTVSAPDGRPASPASACPVEWFVADDHKTSTRYVVIQGSESFDSWLTNLAFDPMDFEDSKLGVKIHRGVYTAALGLYDTLLPLVVQHTHSSPFSKVCFVGHSLGGALATALMLMFKRRGVLTTTSIAPVYTFGGAAAFCDGNTPPASIGRPSAGSAYCGTRGLLHRLGLPEGIVRNIMLNRDIVPRAFTCDYSPVKDILKSMGSAFRELSSLNRPCDSGKVRLYNFVGRIIVVQPDLRLKFVNASEGYHPLLPDGEGIYTFRQPVSSKTSNLDTLHFMYARREDQGASPEVFGHEGGAGGAAEGLTPTPAGRTGTGTGMTGGPGMSGVAGGAPRLQAWRDPGTVRAAIQELMDYPHPLDILRDTEAYGGLGSISRYHNPDSYTQALAHIYRSRLSSLRATAAALRGRRLPSPSPSSDPPPTSPPSLQGEPELEAQALPSVGAFGPISHPSLASAATASLPSMMMSLEGERADDAAASGGSSIDEFSPRPPRGHSWEEHLREESERVAREGGAGEATVGQENLAPHRFRKGTHPFWPGWDEVAYPRYSDLEGEPGIGAGGQRRDRAAAPQEQPTSPKGHTWGL